MRNEGERSSAHSIGQYHHEKDKAFVTKEEWKTVKDLIKEFKLICVPGGATFGLSGFSMAIYLQPEGAPYPGTESEYGPKCMISLTHVLMQKVLGLDRGPELCDKWWDELSKFVFTDENKQLVEKYGLGPLHDKSYYDY